MVDALRWLALEVLDVERALGFYRDRLSLPVARRSPGEAALAAGRTELRLRAPGSVPRGGVHTHFAFETPDAVGTWRDRLGDLDPSEHRFDGSRSLYVADPDGHCVEVGTRGATGEGLTGIFEVVLEVEDLDRAESFYTALGTDPVDRGDRRVRLDAGAFALELWAPRLGIADGRGGLHLDLGVRAGSPRSLAERVGGLALSTEETDAGIRLRDPDGHYVTLG
ncbi:MAG: VOC family protein [Halobacteriales archaeon]